MIQNSVPSEVTTTSGGEREKQGNVSSKTVPSGPVYHDKGSQPKKGGGSSFTVTKLPSSLEPKGQRPLSLPHSP